MERMTAVRFDTELKQVRIEEANLPVAAAGEVRIKVAFAGVCLSDIHFIHGELSPGMPRHVTLGHEISGVVDQVGDNVAKWNPGDRVVVHPVEDLGSFTRVIGVQRDGGWAEYVVAPEASLVSIGADVPLDVAAIIPDAVATPWAAITETANVRPAEAVGVWGVGGLGYHAIKLLRLIGAAPLVAVDPNEAARERALAAGADIALDPGVDDVAGEINRITGGKGLDVAFDFYGSTSIHQSAFDSLARRGRLVLVGIPHTPFHLESGSAVVRKAHQILGHHGSERRHIEELLRLVQLQRLDLTDSISSVHPLPDAHDAIDALAQKRGNPIRVLLRP